MAAASSRKIFSTAGYFVAFVLLGVALLHTCAEKGQLPTTGGQEAQRNSTNALTRRVADTGYPLRRVEGRVTDPKGAGIRLAVVQYKGSRFGTQTRSGGYFSLEVPASADSLRAFKGGYDMLMQPIPAKGDSLVFALPPRRAKLKADSIAQTKGEGNAIFDIVETHQTQISSSGRARPAAAAPRKQPKRYNTEDYNPIEASGYFHSLKKPLSTFSIDVDKAAYSNARRYIQQGQKPPKNALRIEELINAFDYHYGGLQTQNEHPFRVALDQGPCPWNDSTHLIRVGIRGKQIPYPQLPPHHLTFLLDVSGSMRSPKKLPLVKRAMKTLTQRMRPQDSISIVVYAGAAGMVLPPTSGAEKDSIFRALEQLRAGGSTAGGQGLALAYHTAEKHFIHKGNNRVILCTDGDFNVGPSSQGAMIDLIKAKREKGIALTVLGVGTGNLNDAMMEQVANKGNGNYFYLDNYEEAVRVLSENLACTLVTIAKDVKVQVEFNPAKVKSYRLIGYENRALEDKDFADDQKDAGELGAGHRVTALYEVVLRKAGERLPKEESRYTQRSLSEKALKSNEWLSVRLRYKLPRSKNSTLIEVPLKGPKKKQLQKETAFAASVALWGMLLRESPMAAQGNFEQVERMAQPGLNPDPNGHRHAFLKLVRSSATLLEEKEAEARADLRD